MGGYYYLMFRLPPDIRLVLCASGLAALRKGLQSYLDDGSHLRKGGICRRIPPVFEQI